MDLFQLYSRHEASFHAMLYDAATHRSALIGKPVPLEYENRVIRSIMSTLQQPTIGTILATAVLCNVKCITGSTSAAHWLALRKMVEMHGGLASFSHDQILFTKLIWTFIALPGPLTGFDSNTDVGSGACYLERLVQSRQKIVVEMLPIADIDFDHRKNSRRCNAFEPPKIRRLLQGNPLESPTEQNCRISIILFLASAMQFYGDFSSVTDFYLEKLCQNIQEGHDDLALSPAHLLWSLVRLSFANSVSKKCTELWVEVVQMLAVYNQLGNSQKRILESILFSSLEIPDHIDDTKERWQLEPGPLLGTKRDQPEFYDRCIPPDCFCELLWFTASPKWII